MIISFADRETELIFRERPSKRLPREIQSRALRKLQVLHAATELREVAVPPSNRLEMLVGDLLGMHSIRINRQWRICFRWFDGDAFDVQICDYHH